MKKKLKKIKEPINELRIEFRKQLVTLIVSSFGFVAALFWRDAIKSMIETYRRAVINKLEPITMVIR